MKLNKVIVLVQVILLVLLVTPHVNSFSGIAKEVPNKIYDFYADVNGNCTFEYYFYLYEVYGDPLNVIATNDPNFVPNPFDLLSFEGSPTSTVLFSVEIVANNLQKNYAAKFKDSGLTISVNRTISCTVMPTPIINKYGFRSLNISKIPFEFYFVIENKEKAILDPLTISLSSPQWAVDNNHHFVDQKTYVVYLYPPLQLGNTTLDMKITFPDGKEKTIPVEVVFGENLYSIGFQCTPSFLSTSYMFAIQFNTSGNPPIFYRGLGIPDLQAVYLNRPVYGNSSYSTSRGVFLGVTNAPSIQLDAYMNGIKEIGTYNFLFQLPSGVGTQIQFEPIEFLQLPGFNFEPLIFNLPLRNMNYRPTQEYDIYFKAGTDKYSYTPSSPFYLQDGCYGIVSGKIDDYIFNINLIVSQFNQNYEINFYLFNVAKTYSLIPSSLDGAKPTLVSLQVIPLPLGFNRYFIVRAQINDDISGFRMMRYQSNHGTMVPFMSSKDMVQGNPLEGIYEKVYDEPSFLSSYIYVEDYASNFDSFGLDLTIANETKLIKISNPEQFNKQIQTLEFTSAYWTHNDIDVSSFAYSTNFRFNVTNAIKLACPVLTLENFDNYPTTNYYGKWNEKLKLYEIVVTIPLRTFFGVVDYSLNYGGTRTNSTFLNTVFPSSELRVFSEDADMFGPEIETLTQFPSQTVTLSAGGGDKEIGWIFVITDRLNGIKSGNITVLAEGDLTEYSTSVSNFPNTSTVVTVEVRIPVKEKCLTQTYSIKSIYFEDHGGYISNITNMFINYLEYAYQSIYVICPSSTDVSPPVLINFQIIQGSQVDVSLDYRGGTVSFNLTVDDTGDGVKVDKLPYIYLTSINEIIKHQVSNSIVQGTKVTYTGFIRLPYGFGYPDPVLISIYGIVDNAGNFAGFTSQKLYDSGFPFFINTTIFTKNTYPCIESTSDITTDGGKLVIMGRAFGANSYVYISDGIIPVGLMVTPSFSTSTVLIIDVKPITTKGINLQVQTGSQFSQPFYVIPKPAIVYPSPLPSSSSSSHDSSSQETHAPTQTPTNPATQPPNPCINDCGGSLQGYCSSTGCICYSPWTGIDCKSKVIIIPTPSFNNTLPSFNISIPTEFLITGLLSIIELQELDTNNVAIYKYPFTQWIVSIISTDNEPIKFLYSTNITNQLDQSITNVSVSIQYFDKQ
ncbi:hypothetical protein CYY_009843, partial [Polysphondylium violaceum]